jgi:uncharacterized protein
MQLAVGTRHCPVCGTLQLFWAPGIAGQSLVRPAGWYTDPFERTESRYWNGDVWTGHINWGAQSRDVLAFDQRKSKLDVPRFSSSVGASLALTMTGLIIAFALAFGVVYLLIALGRPGGLLVTLSVSEAGLWAGFFGTCLFISKRYGSGSLRRDFQLRFRWVDIAIGLLGSVVARCFSIAVLIPLALTHRVLENPEAPVVQTVTTGLDYWVVITVITCVGAPFFEELFFRGLLQGQLVQRFGPGIGIVVTALVFGAAHIANSPDVAGLVYALSVGGAGIALGVIRHMSKRLGSSMATHAFFNTTAVVLLATLTYH